MRGRRKGGREGKVLSFGFLLVRQHNRGLVTGREPPSESLAHLTTTLDFPHFTTKAGVVKPYLAISRFRGVVGDVGAYGPYRPQALHGRRGVLLDASQTAFQSFHPRGGVQAVAVDVGGRRCHVAVVLLVLHPDDVVSSCTRVE